MHRSIAVLMTVFFLTGCTGGFFKMPKDEYRKTVRTLGVLPLMVDADSTITHPEREAVVNLLRRSSAGREGRLLEMLQDKKIYFDVRLVPGDPGQMYTGLVKGSLLRGEGDKLYRHYDFAAANVAALAQRHVVDALLVVILHGVERPQKRWDRTRLSYLQADYNDIVATAAVILPSGEIVWEYPAAGEALLSLQYPDFDEAHYNRNEQVRVKYVTPAGLERVLAEQTNGLFGRGAFSRRYQAVFSDIVTALQPGLVNPLKSREPAPPAGNN